MNSRKGFLLVQLGSPENLSPKKIGEYLYDFLGDSHTLGNPPFFWKPLLRFVIIPLSRKKSLAKYQRMFERNHFTEMPLVSYSTVFLEKLRKELPETPVELAYQYGCKPCLEESIEKLSSLGVEEIYVVPLYPQRSAVTTGAALDQVKMALSKTSFVGKTFYAEGFFSHSAWVQEVVRSIQGFLKPNTSLVLSFHGVQESRVRNGDPYEMDCEESARLIGEALGVKPFVAYQSKYGKGKWLSPSLLETLEKLGRSKGSVLVATPAFTADNLETIFEIDDEARGFFTEAGGESFERVPCLNDSDSWVKVFAHEVLKDLPYKPL